MVMDQCPRQADLQSSFRPAPTVSCCLVSFNSAHVTSIEKAHCFEGAYDMGCPIWRAGSVDRLASSLSILEDHSL